MYIVFSDKLVISIFNNPLIISNVQTYKGIGFIIVTALLLFLLVWSEIKKIEKNKNLIQESEKKFRSIFNYSNIGIALADSDGNLIDVNDEIVKLLGYSRDELLNVNFSDFTHPDDLEKEIELVEKIKNGSIEGYRLEKKILDKAGKILWMDTSITSKRNINNEVDIFIGMVMDITNKKVSEKEIIEQKNKYEKLYNELTQKNKELVLAKDKAVESDRLKTVFLNNLSHEIRTPMNGIMGFADFLDEPDLTIEERKNFAKIIKKSSKRLLKIVEDILEISSLETKQVKIRNEEFDISGLIEEIEKEYRPKAEQKGIKFICNSTINNSEQYLYSDRQKIKIIADKLLDNALKFTLEGSVILNFGIKDDVLKISVEDSGISIDPKHKDYVFKRFTQIDSSHTRQAGGLGIGLPIANENAKLIGGDISFKCPKGQGCIFYFSLPIKTNTHSNNDNSKNTTGKSGKNIRQILVLVAEDVDSNFLFLKNILERSKTYNVKIIRARNGQEALDKYRENKNIDLVLMDIKLPLMNGNHVAQKIKSEGNNIPIIAQTAYASQEDKEIALSYGCDDFVTKPIDKDILFKKMKKFLRNT